MCIIHCICVRFYSNRYTNHFISRWYWFWFCLLLSMTECNNSMILFYTPKNVHYIKFTLEIFPNRINGKMSEIDWKNRECEIQKLGMDWVNKMYSAEIGVFILFYLKLHRKLLAFIVGLPFRRQPFLVSIYWRGIQYHTHTHIEDIMLTIANDSLLNRSLIPFILACKCFMNSFRFLICTFRQI